MRTKKIALRRLSAEETATEEKLTQFVCLLNLRRKRKSRRASERDGESGKSDAMEEAVKLGALQSSSTAAGIVKLAVVCRSRWACAFGDS